MEYPKKSVIIRTLNINNNTSSSKSSSKEEDLSEEVIVLQSKTMSSAVKLNLRRDRKPIEFAKCSVVYHPDVMKVLNYWNNSPGLPHHRVPKSQLLAPSKTIVQILQIIRKVLNGTYIQHWPPYSVEDIIRSIDGFKQRLTNPDYLPIEKSKLKGISLRIFFWNPWAIAIPSMFLECFNNPPQLVRNAVPLEREENPQITEWLKKLYVEKILLGMERKFAPLENNHFIRGANLLFHSIPNLRQKANLTTGPREFCEYVLDALIKQFGKKGVKIGNVGSEWTYHDLLPRYLTDIGRID